MMGLSSLQSTTLDNTLGAIFVGVAVSSLYVVLCPQVLIRLRKRSVFGITTLQVCTYYHRYPGDSLLHKSSVRAQAGFDI